MPAGPFDLWVILYAARLINLPPASVSRSIAKLNAKGVRLHDTITLKDYTPMDRVSG